MRRHLLTLLSAATIAVLALTGCEEPLDGDTYEGSGNVAALTEPHDSVSQQKVQSARRAARRTQTPNQLVSPAAPTNDEAFEDQWPTDGDYD